MSISTKIELKARKVQAIDDITDIVAMLFPGNRNQQHAAVRILVELKGNSELAASLSHLEEEFDISRRTLQRTRAKLARLGLIERISWMNRRYHGREGWKIATRFSASLRRLADQFDQWVEDDAPVRAEKDRVLAELLR